MRIFKNRGDIYFSRANKKKSAEQKILITALAATVILTVLFVVFLGVKNDFSIKKFFSPENMPTQSDTTQQEQESLPEVSGKTNVITAVCDDNRLLFICLVQTDMDSKAYKVCALRQDTQLDGSALSSIYESGGIQNVKTAIESTMKISFDYYIAITQTDFEEFFDSMGSVNYPILNDIKFSGGGESSYNLKISAGEQNINGKRFVNLIRYYLEEENNSSLANDVCLAALSQLLNSENSAERDELFKAFLATAQTDITVRDFSAASDIITVMSSDYSSMGAYNAAAEYENTAITDETLRKVKGYFVK